MGKGNIVNSKFMWREDLVPGKSFQGKHEVKTRRDKSNAQSGYSFQGAC